MQFYVCWFFCVLFEQDFWILNFSISIIFSLKIGNVLLFFSVYLCEYEHMGYFFLFERFGVTV